MDVGNIMWGGTITNWDDWGAPVEIMPLASKPLAPGGCDDCLVGSNINGDLFLG